MYVVRCPLHRNLLMSRSTIRTLVVNTVAFAVIGAAAMLDVTIAIRAPPPKEHGPGSVVGQCLGVALFNDILNGATI